MSVQVNKPSYQNIRKSINPKSENKVEIFVFSAKTRHL